MAEPTPSTPLEQPNKRLDKAGRLKIIADLLSAPHRLEEHALSLFCKHDRTRLSESQESEVCVCLAIWRVHGHGHCTHSRAIRVMDYSMCFLFLSPASTSLIPWNGLSENKSSFLCMFRAGCHVERKIALLFLWTVNPLVFSINEVTAAARAEGASFVKFEPEDFQLPLCKRSVTQDSRSGRGQFLDTGCLGGLKVKVEGHFAYAGEPVCS